LSGIGPMPNHAEQDIRLLNDFVGEQNTIQE
jgi:hypothetical protein